MARLTTITSRVTQKDFGKRSPPRARIAPTSPRQPPPPACASRCRVFLRALRRDAEDVVTAFSQGVNQSAQGTDKVDAIINCHLATGRIGAPGEAPFSLTGQPNAMGGREVGGLANQLAAHMGFSDAEVDRVRRFWNAPRIATRERSQSRANVRGHRARRDQGAVGDGDESRRLAAAGGRGARRARKARSLRRLGKCAAERHDRVGAHVLLPAAAWGEKTEPSPIRSGASRASALSCLARARPSRTGASFADVAARMGFAEAFGFRSAADVFREHAALSAFENDGARDFDIGGLAELSDEASMRCPRRCGRSAPARRKDASASSAMADISPPTARRASLRRSRPR